jgi:hypothetical protein
MDDSFVSVRTTNKTVHFRTSVWQCRLDLHSRNEYFGSDVPGSGQKAVKTVRRQKLSIVKVAPETGDHNRPLIQQRTPVSGGSWSIRWIYKGPFNSCSCSITPYWSEMGTSVQPSPVNLLQRRSIPTLALTNLSRPWRWTQHTFT